MKTKNLFTIVLGIVGTLLLGIGMSVLLVPEFDAFVPGVVVGSIGLLTVLTIVPIWVKPKKVSFGLVMAYLVGVVGAILLGVSLSHILTEQTLELNELLGSLAYGVPGVLICSINPLAYVTISKRKARNEGLSHA